MKLLHSFVAAVAVLLALPVLAGAGLFLILSVTVAGRLVAVALLLGTVALLVAVFALTDVVPRRRKPFLQLAVLTAVAAVTIFAVAARLAPPEAAASAADGRFRSVWVGDRHEGEGRFSPARVVPEIDQILLALWFMPYLDDTATVEGTKRLRTAFLEIYDGLEAQADFARAGTALGQAYTDWLDRPWTPGHLYAYLPDGGASDEPMPVVIFLHGGGGNLKAAPWIWRRFAERNRVAFVAPTCGAGNWDSERGEEAIEGALRFCRQQSRLDAGRVVLVGSGRGALGLPRASLHFEDAFQRMIFIAPIMDSPRIRSQDFADRWSGKPVLVIHADQDLRSPIADVRADTEWMIEKGVDLAFVRFPDEDHYFLWKRSDAVMERIEQWLAL